VRPWRGVEANRGGRSQVEAFCRAVDRHCYSVVRQCQFGVAQALGLIAEQPKGGRLEVIATAIRSIWPCPVGLPREEPTLGALVLKCVQVHGDVTVSGQDPEAAG